MLTAESITDDQIRELFRARPDASILFRDKVNLHETAEPYASIRRDARARCAEILNARAQAPKRTACPDLDPNWPGVDGRPRGPVLCVSYPSCSCGREDARAKEAK